MGSFILTPYLAGTPAIFCWMLVRLLFIHRCHVLCLPSHLSCRQAPLKPPRPRSCAANHYDRPRIALSFTPVRLRRWCYPQKSFVVIQVPFSWLLWSDTPGPSSFRPGRNCESLFRFAFSEFLLTRQLFPPLIESHSLY